MPNKKTVPISVSVTPVLLEQIDELLAQEGAFISRSDVVRAAIKAYYAAERPKYIYERSATDKIKREKMATEKNFEAMTDLEYAKTFKGAEVIKNRQGQDIFVMLTLGNSVRGLPVEGIKKWKGNPVFEAGIEGHEQQVAMGASVLDRIRGDQHFYQKFDKEYNIDLPAYFNETNIENNDTDSGSPAEAGDSGVEE